MMMPMAFPVGPDGVPLGGLPPLLLGPGGMSMPPMDGTQAWICEVQAMSMRLQMLAASVPQPLLPHSHHVETSTAESMRSLFF